MENKILSHSAFQIPFTISVAADVVHLLTEGRVGEVCERIGIIMFFVSIAMVPILLIGRHSIKDPLAKWSNAISTTCIILIDISVVLISISLLDFNGGLFFQVLGILGIVIIGVLIALSAIKRSREGTKKS